MSTRFLAMKNISTIDSEEIPPEFRVDRYRNNAEVHIQNKLQTALVI